MHRNKKSQNRIRCCGPVSQRDINIPVLHV